jgi:hypothetical protein
MTASPPGNFPDPIKRAIDHAFPRLLSFLLSTSEASCSRQGRIGSSIPWLRPWVYLMGMIDWYAATQRQPLATSLLDDAEMQARNESKAELRWSSGDALAL